jgi:hypothetical protein
LLSSDAPEFDGRDISADLTLESPVAEKMELSNKAMKTVTKIYHAMCLQGARAAQKTAN